MLFIFIFRSCDSIFYNGVILLDGLDRIDPSEPPNALKAQLCGLLQAVAYLKGMILSMGVFFCRLSSCWY